MAKKRDQDLLAEQIKEMENKKRADVAQNTPVVRVHETPSEEPKMSFDEWWMRMERKHPQKMPRHTKEILSADFRARGLRKEETASKYDWALDQYGIKL